MSNPICINYGCNSSLHTRRIAKKTGKKEPRSVCGHCHLAGMGRHPYKKDVTPFKQGKCSNEDGRLGFICKAEIVDWCQTELDHIDGEKLNNVPENIQELCRNCHAVKTKANGDSRNNKTKPIRSIEELQDMGYTTALFS